MAANLDLYKTTINTPLVFADKTLQDLLPWYINSEKETLWLSGIYSCFKTSLKKSKFSSFINLSIYSGSHSESWSKSYLETKFSD